MTQQVYCDLLNFVFLFLRCECFFMQSYLYPSLKSRHSYNQRMRDESIHPENNKINNLVGHSPIWQLRARGCLISQDERLPQNECGNVILSKRKSLTLKSWNQNGNILFLQAAELRQGQSILSSEIIISHFGYFTFCFENCCISTGVWRKKTF